jgi:hypothetical protein
LLLQQKTAAARALSAAMLEAQGTVTEKIVPEQVRQRVLGLGA